MEATVLNIAAYRFVAVADPASLAAQIRERAEAHALRGTVLVAPEGINVFLAGTDGEVRAWLAWLRRDERFAGIVVKESRSAAVPFAKLKVKTKREIIAFRRDGIDPLRARAPAVDPRTLQRWLDQGHDDEGRGVVLLDTRNREEVAHGTFHDAVTLPIDDFVDLPTALSAHGDALADRTVVSFCTGGIRCEKAALWMREHGFPDVLQLDGGILNWFEQVGGAHYRGACFVFDDRVALAPDLTPVPPAAQEAKTATIAADEQR